MPEDGPSVDLAAGTLASFARTGDGCYLDNADADTLRDMVRQLVDELAIFRAVPFLARAADRLYEECARAVRDGRVDARSPIGDATLDYRELRAEAPDAR